MESENRKYKKSLEDTILLKGFKGMTIELTVQVSDTTMLIVALMLTTKNIYVTCRPNLLKAASFLLCPPHPAEQAQQIYCF